MPLKYKDAYEQMHEKIHRKDKMRWRIVVFSHPKEEKSVLYRQNLTDKQLLEAIKRALELGANLMSIRGFEEK